jgi:predicted glycosyltransferase
MGIWVDFENTPHVLILKPIIEELQRRNHQVFITARDCSQTLELANYFKMNAHRISHHHGKKKINKILGHVSRILRLLWFSRDKDISVALSHGSRSQIIAAGFLKIPTFVMWDYEYASLSFIHRFIDRLVVPEVLSVESFNCKIDSKKILKYPGIKEHIYVANLMNNGVALQQLSLDPGKIIITIRPPAVDAHYYNHRDGSNDLFLEALKYFSSFDQTILIVLARTKFQQENIIKFAQKNGNSKNIIFPPKAQNGIALIWNSDIVIGGGGTMNREAAVLNVPVYSIFQGKLGAVDRYLNKTGHLTIIRSKEDLKTIKLIKRKHPQKPHLKENRDLINYIVEEILEIGMTGR